VVDLGGGGGATPDARPRSHPLPRALAWGAVYYLATWLGTLTLIQGGLLTLASPAAGVAAVWFVFGSRRTWIWDAPILLVCAFISNVRIGAPDLLLVTSPLVTLLQVAAFVIALHHLAPGLRPVGGIPQTLRTLRDLSGFLLAAAISGTVAAIATNLTQAAAGISTGDPRFLLIRWGRNTSTIVVIGAVGLIVGPAIYRAVRRHELTDEIRQRLAGWSTRRLIEGVALTAASVVLYTVCFGFASGYSIAFLLFVTTAWVGLRFSPGTIAVHSLLTGTLAVSFTVLGDGIFGRLDDPTVGAALVQLFVLVTTCTGLILGLSREALAAADRKSTQHSLMLDSVLTEVDDGILLMEESGAVLMVNRAARHLLELDTPGADAPGTAMDDGGSLTRRALDGETVQNEEIRICDADGEIRRILRTSARLLPQAPDDPSPRRILVSYHDVTADRRQREALMKFAGEVAHDLKNPLSVVSGWTDALLEEFDDGSVTPERGAPMARRVMSAAVHMRDFISNMLDYTVSRDQALNTQDVDLGQLAEQVASLRIDGAADGEPPAISVEGHEHVWVDPLLVRVLLDNLIGNAVKYVAPGVRPRIAVGMAAVDERWVEVEVSDNGIGITPAQQDRIFETFARVEQEGYQGTGLGLAICQRIVRRHGGSITVDGAALGTGTAFRFTLPRTRAAYDEHEQALADGS
jgi:signal transduction histidine kinase